MEKTTPLDRLFAEFGQNRRSIAVAVGVTAQAVMLWTKDLRKIRAETAVAIEEKAGIPRSRLRPDLWPVTVTATRRKKSVVVTPEATPIAVDTAATIIPRRARSPRPALRESG